MALRRLHVLNKKCFVFKRMIINGREASSENIRLI